MVVKIVSIREILQAITGGTSSISVTSAQSQVEDSLTRPDNTTGYTTGDVVGEDPATNLSFSSVCASNGDAFIVMGVNLQINSNAVPSGMGAFRLHLYNAAPTAIGDNSAMNLISGDRSKYLGYIDLEIPSDIGDTLWSQNDNINFKSKLAADSTTLYGVLETRAAYTPVAETVYKIQLKIISV